MKLSSVLRKALGFSVIGRKKRTCKEHPAQPLFSSGRQDDGATGLSRPASPRPTIIQSSTVPVVDSQQEATDESPSVQTPPAPRLETISLPSLPSASPVDAPALSSLDWSVVPRASRSSSPPTIPSTVGLGVHLGVQCSHPDASGFAIALREKNQDALRRLFSLTDGDLDAEHLDLSIDTMLSDLKEYSTLDFVGLDLKPPGRTDIAYRVSGLINSGAHGFVLAAEADGQQVAIKVMDKVEMYSMGSHTRMYLLREKVILEVATQKGSEYLTGLCTSWSDIRFIYFVMPLYPQDLGDYMCTCPPSQFPFRLFAAELITAVGELHHMGWVHRDIKPSNILVSSDGHLTLADFGVAYPCKFGALPEGWAGSAGYCAPEVVGNGIFGSRYYDERADIWSLGVVLLETISRSPAPIYSGRNVDEIAYKILTLEPKELPPMQTVRMSNNVLYDLLSKMLVRNPENRWTTRQLKQHGYFNGANWGNLRSWALQNQYIPLPVTRTASNGDVAAGYAAHLCEPEVSRSVKRLIKADAEELRATDPFRS